jgi:hypothetical protein
MVNKKSQKNLAEQLKTKLNSPDYVAMPDLLSNNDYYSGFLVNSECIVLQVFTVLDGLAETKRIIYPGDLEQKDWKEVTNLIKKRNQERNQIFKKKSEIIEDKLNSIQNLYYYSGSKLNLWHGRATSWITWKGGRGYTTFSGKLNNRGYGLYIAENHPILDNFSFQTGFYLIDTDKPIERVPYEYWNDGGEDNPNNFKRMVEVGDKITIIPFDQINSLSKLFKERCIKQIILTNTREDLLIENNQNNNNQLVSKQQIANDPELNTVKNYLLENNKTSINQEELNSLLNANLQIQWPSPNGNSNLEKNLVIGGGLLLVVGLLISLLVKSKRIKK